MRQVLPQSSRDQSRRFQLPAPVGGWNTVSPVAEMPSTDAIILDNLFPHASGVMSRKGSEVFATLPEDSPPSSPHAIRALLPYSSPTGTKKLFAAANDGLYDVSAGGTVSVVSSSATNAEWQYVNTSTAGGNFLWCCNGVDKARVFNGTSWTVLDGASTPAITGVTSSSIANVSLFSTRLILCLTNTLSFYYSGVNSIAGAMTEFPLGSVFKRGGYLLATGSWTVDSGSGLDDKFVAVTSEGEVVVYAGTDPSSAANWVKQGLYYVGEPLGRRCLINLGGDLFILTKTGVISLSKLLQSSLIDRNTSLSNKIENFFHEVTSQWGSNFGWSGTVYPEKQMLLINVPLGNNVSWQFVMNTTTGAWCRFLGWNAEAWAYHDGELFFGARNIVRKAWTGEKDILAAIQIRAKTAFQHPSRSTRGAQVAMVRPILNASADVKLSLGLDTDYESSPFSSSGTTISQQTSRWDEAIWDASYWSGSLTVSEWRTVFHRPGAAFALRFRGGIKDASFTWLSTDFIIHIGGIFS